MADITITGMPAAGALTGEELVEIAQLSTSVRISAATLSALASDNSFNDSGSGFVAAGFAVNDRVHVSGFTGNVANNILVGVVTALTAGKMTIGGTDGDVIVDDAAGETVVISKWVTRQAPRRHGGAAFPSAPATGDIFYRTDRHIEYFYDGTRWLSTQLYEGQIAINTAFTSLAATTDPIAYWNNPWAGTYTIYLETVRHFINVTGTGSWTGHVANSSGTDIASVTQAVAGASGETDAINTTYTGSQVHTRLVENSGTATCLYLAAITYRLVG